MRLEASGMKVDTEAAKSKPLFPNNVIYFMSRQHDNITSCHVDQLFYCSNGPVDETVSSYSCVVDGLGTKSWHRHEKM